MAFVVATAIQTRSLFLTATVVSCIAGCGVGSTDQAPSQKEAAWRFTSQVAYLDRGSTPDEGDLCFKRGDETSALETSPTDTFPWILGCISLDKRFGAFLILDLAHSGKESLKIYEFGPGDPELRFSTEFGHDTSPGAMAWVESELLLTAPEGRVLSWSPHRESLSKIDRVLKPSEAVSSFLGEEAASLFAAFPRWLLVAAGEVASTFEPTPMISSSASHWIPPGVQLLRSAGVIRRNPMPFSELFGDVIRTDEGSSWLVSNGTTHYKFRCDQEGHVVAREQIQGPGVPIRFLRFGGSSDELLCGVDQAPDSGYERRNGVTMGSVYTQVEVHASTSDPQQWHRVLHDVGQAWGVGGRSVLPRTK